jgi:two-component system, cell cycle sensor histidine kinase and response regulator CckA
MTVDDSELRRLAVETAFRETSAAIYVMTTDGRFVAGNAALEARTGRAWDQLEGMDFDATVHPDDRARVHAAFDAAASGITQRYEARGIRPDGTVFYASAVNSPVLRDGEVIGVVGVAHDRDEIVDVRTSLDRDAERLRGALDGIADAIAFVDREWRLTYINSVASQLLGRGSTELVGSSLWDLDIDDDEGAEMLRESMRTGRRLVRRRFDEGLSRWMEVVAFPAGDLLGMQVRDVTEVEEARRRVQDDARLMHARSMLMDDSRDAIVMRGLGDVIEYANASAGRMFDAGEPAELVGRRLVDVLGLDEETSRRIEAAIARDGSWRGDLVLHPPNGTELVTENHWVVVDGPEGYPDAVFCIISDATERRREHEIVVRTQRMESIGTLASGIAHDLNNVLTPLLLSTQLLAAEETDPRRLRILDGMRGTVQRGGDMIRQVLTFARGVEGDKTVVDIAALTRRFADFCHDILPKDIQVEVSSEDQLAVLGDPTQLLQVLMNLATNARDAMPDGGRLSLTASRDLDRMVIEVADDGDGMSPDALARIFEPFYTTKGVGRGTGLGLSVSQAIARTHGGSLEARSTLGAGTTFRLDLPLTAWTAEECPELTTGVNLDGVRVLIVDDEDEIVDLAALVVSGAGGIALGATDALDAQRLLDDAPVDVIVSDLVMPGTSGREFLCWLGANRSNIPVVAMSGIPEQGAHAARRANVRATLDKPFTAESLIAAILAAATGDDA